MPVDANFANVSLLLHGDGANGSTTIVDNSIPSKVVTAFGNAQISTAQSKFGGASAYFDGAGDYLTAPTGADFAFGTGDFTVECWIRSTTVSGLQLIYDSRAGSIGSASGMSLAISSGSLRCDTDVGGVLAGGTVAANTWHHVALTRLSGVFKLWLDGIQVSSSSAAYTLSDGVMSVGQYGGSSFFDGYIDDFRITKGVARYTTNFTPPASAFADGAAQVSGVIRDSTGALCARTVRLVRRDTGALVGSTVSNASTGVYEINTPTLDEVVRIVHSNTTTPPLENDLIDRVIPI